MQERQGESHGPGAPVVLQRLGAVELVAHITGHRFVEMGFDVREPVGNGVGDALWKQGGCVEREQALLHHAPHQIGDIRRVHTVAEPALEAVAVEQRQEELEVLFLAVVRGGGQQQ